MKYSVFSEFVKNVENRITPKGIAKLYTNAESLGKLPLAVQHYLVKKGSKNNPYMGFVVEPYSLFLAYEINENDIENYIPEEYELIPSSIFENEDRKMCAIIGCFNVHTSVFWGSRFELYIIARNKKNNLLSWVICDYESNTINYDPDKGFLTPTLGKCVYTTTHNGNIICDIESIKSNNTIKLDIDISNTSCIELNKQLWIEGNLSIDYSGELNSKGNEPFGLIFDPAEMNCAQLIDTKSIRTNEIEFGFIKKRMKPFAACCFQYAQHYVTTVFQKGHEIKDKNDLENKIDEIVKDINA
jgi:hypothetical protein